MTIRVAIVDDQTLFAETLRVVLDTDPGIEVVGVAQTGQDLLALVPDTAVDVAIIDVEMPGMSGIETVQTLARTPQAVPVRVLMLTVHTSAGVVRAALNAQVEGFVSKNIHRDELVRAIRTVADGGRVVSSELAATAALIGPNPLTPTEQAVLRSATAGGTSRQIAEELFLTTGTIKNHLSHAIHKLGVANRAQAIRKAQDNGWI